MADNQKHARGSHFASPDNTGSSPRFSTSSGANSGAGKHASGARFKTTASAAPSTTASSRLSKRAQAAQGSPSNTGMVSVATPRSAAQRAADARGGHSAKGALIGVIAGIAVVAVLAILVVPRLFAALEPVAQQSDLANQGQTVQIVIPDGSGATDVSSILYDAGLIADGTEFLNEMVSQGADSQLKSGAYSFTVGMDYESIVKQLVEGPNSSAQSLTIPEGYTVESIAATVESALGISASDFLAQAKASNYVSDYSFLESAAANTEYDSLEGFLYPKTYDFSTVTDLSADTVIRAMLDQFQTEISSLDLSYVESRGLSIAEMVNLASIVEKESTQSTGAMVAAVFWNRLGNMGDPNYGFLQSDATTAYTVKHDPTADEVHDENDPYSTYTHQGLPPTPICNPSITSLQAVCSPDMEYIDGGYYYFYFWNDDNGQIQYAFSKTLDEHNAVIANH